MTFERLGTAITAGLTLWFCQDLVFGESVPFFRDLTTYFYPLRFSLFESYSAGTLPLWNRHMAMGFPVLADFQSGAFYPPHLLFLVFSFFPAIRVIFIVHFLIAAVGSYRLFRFWKHTWYLAILGALLFTLGGMLVSLTNLINHFQTAVWLPWVILAWEKLLRELSWKNFLTVTLILSVQFLAGSPEFFALSMMLVLIDGFRIKALTPDVTIGRMISLFTCASLLVAALTMAQLLPTLELFLESRRQQAIPAHEALHWSLNPRALLNLFFLDKEVDPSSPVGMRFFFAPVASFLVSYYLGAISSFGICLWLFLGSFRKKLVTLGLVAGSLLLAMGNYTPIYPFLYRHLPMLSAIRFPEKFFYVTYALLIYLTVDGVAALLGCEGKKLKQPLLIVSIACLAWFGSYAYVRSHLNVVSQLIVPNAGVIHSSSVHADMVAAVLANFERQIILSFAILLLLVLGKTEMIRRTLFAFLLVATAFIDLAWAHRSYLLTVKPEFVYTTPRILQTPDQERNRLFYYPSNGSLHPSSLAIQGRPPFKDANALSVQNLLPNGGTLYGFDYFQEIDAMARRPYTEFLSMANSLDAEEQIKLLRTFNIGYLVSFQPLAVEGTILVAHFPQFFSWLYKIEKVVPRVYLVDKSTVEKHSTQVLRRLASREFDPMQEVVLDREAGVNPQRGPVGTAKIGRYDHEGVMVRTSLNHSGILVLADSHYPGWKAYVDGEATPILKANHFFRAVVLPQGDHVVEFKYEPRSFKVGLIVSLLTVIALVTISGTVYLRGCKPLLPKRPPTN